MRTVHATVENVQQWLDSGTWRSYHDSWLSCDGLHAFEWKCLAANTIQHTHRHSNTAFQNASKYSIVWVTWILLMQFDIGYPTVIIWHLYSTAMTWRKHCCRLSTCPTSYGSRNRSLLQPQPNIKHRNVQHHIGKDLLGSDWNNVEGLNILPHSVCLCLFKRAKHP